LDNCLWCYMLLHYICSVIYTFCLMYSTLLFNVLISAYMVQLCLSPIFCQYACFSCFKCLNHLLWFLLCKSLSAYCQLL
jgi:hypothetical protein